MVAIIDSSIIPLPVPGSSDVLLLWLVSRGGKIWILVPAAIVGSMVGGYASWRIGRKGGQAALRRYTSPRLLEPVSKWMKRSPVLTVFLPAMFPPPFPLTPFVITAGSLGVQRRRFLCAFGAARTLRYLLISWLGVAYGRHVTRIWTAVQHKWSQPLLWSFVAIVVLSAASGVWQSRKRRAASLRTHRSINAAASRSN
jgi:membrane protein YqaA with SNARE-associated domain